MPSASRLTGWQQRLLPLMSTMLVGLTLFFFVASFIQLLNLQTEIRKEPAVSLSDGVLKAALLDQGTAADRLAAVRLRAAAELEVQVVGRRYRQATVLLMSRVWTLYLGFVTGMILALVGAAFILGKLREPPSDLSLASAAGDWSVKSSSPGIILAALGTALMLATVLANHRIDVIDSPLYLRDVPPELPAAQPAPRLDNPFSGSKPD